MTSCVYLPIQVVPRKRGSQPHALLPLGQSRRGVATGSMDRCCFLSLSAYTLLYLAVVYLFIFSVYNVSYHTSCKSRLSWWT